MKAMAAQWERWAARFASLTQRERAILAGAIVLGGGFLIFSFGVDPYLLKARNANQAESAARTEFVQQSAQLTLLTEQNADPDAVNRNKLAQAKKDLGAVSERLARFEGGMVPPARMQAFLQGLLAKNSGIELLGLETLPVTLVGASPADKSDAPAQSTPPSPPLGRDVPAPETVAPADGIYQHGIEIRLAGSYNALLSYLEELERMPQRVMWNHISLTVEKYPRNVMVLRVYTLSLDRNWLVV